ncbi:hypothetical protein TNIN_116061 [Trichonephila inaurata madagascariensis]|uniref:Uncharacterized protein n=1 Tax=Trichonephila inaurata madagascariensis TaxID=2747483 RepID=A0A8X6WQQ0_9ARAC|nr:hypothetical protein TNIN_116061 [Trichonephila inaurata madagascariensis]
MDFSLLTAQVVCFKRSSVKINQPDLLYAYSSTSRLNGTLQNVVSLLLVNTGFYIKFPAVLKKYDKTEVNNENHVMEK